MLVFVSHFAFESVQPVGAFGSHGSGAIQQTLVDVLQVYPDSVPGQSESAVHWTQPVEVHLPVPWQLLPILEHGAFSGMQIPPIQLFPGAQSSFPVQFGI